MPRQKRTETRPTLSAEALDDLTPKQFAFVRAILEGKTATDAYRQAYDAQNMADDTIWAEASRLRHDRKVAAWVSAARQANMDTAKLTIESHMAELASLRDHAKATGNVGAAVLAETNRGKAAGLYTDRIEDVTRGNDTANGIYAKLLKLDPELARMWAARAGLDVVSAHDDTSATLPDNPVTH